MAIAQNRMNWGQIVTMGIAGGIVGGILIDAFIYFSTLATAHHASILEVWRYVASTAMGKDAYSSPVAPWVGLLLHALVSFAWGVGYAYMAKTRPLVGGRPWLSGFVFGCIVWVIMQFVLILGRTWVPFTWTSFFVGIIGTIVFFGFPVALVVRAMLRDA